jgi:CBS domain-containing protein
MKLSDYDQMPTVAALMKSSPYFARPDDTVAQIDRLMNQHNIRHVPIKQGEQVVGIISERDLRWMRSPALLLPDPEEILVAHVQVNNPYTVEITTPLNTVLQEMSKRKIGAAVVVKSGELAGIITVTDICNALAEILTAQFSQFPAT